MRPSLTPLGPSVSRDRVITSFPKWYTPAACLQLREHFHGQVSAACQRGNTGTVGFCKNVFNHDYKATIGVDFEIERFEVAGTPFSLQIWDTAGQEKFKCIASAYYRGAQVIITAFDLTDVQTLEHARQWLEDALRENEPGACFLFLVGTKKDLLSGAACEQAEAEAVRLANEMQAEYWSVSAKTDIGCTEEKRANAQKQRTDSANRLLGWNETTRNAWRTAGAKAVGTQGLYLGVLTPGEGPLWTLPGVQVEAPPPPARHKVVAVPSSLCPFLRAPPSL
nr:ras-related protein Rab-36 isoform X2 [Odocoileus virginianus texanus]